MSSYGLDRWHAGGPKRPSACHTKRPLSWVVMGGSYGCSALSSARKGLLSGVWNPWVCIAAVENPLGTWFVRGCVFVCLSPSVPTKTWGTMWLAGISAKAQTFFIIKVCHTPLLNPTLSFFSLPSFNEYAFVMCEHVCATQQPQLRIRPELWPSISH